MNTRDYDNGLKIYDENELIKEDKRHSIKLELIGKMKPAESDEVLDRSEMDKEELNKKIISTPSLKKTVLNSGKFDFRVSIFWSRDL